MYTKVCNKCKIEKSYNNFHKKTASSDGLQDTCKECKSNLNSQRFASDSEEDKLIKEVELAKTALFNYRQKRYEEKLIEEEIVNKALEEYRERKKVLSIS
jgi:transposase-like protein